MTHAIALEHPSLRPEPLPCPDPGQDGEIICNFEYRPGQRASARVRYRLWGSPDAPVCVALGGISAGRHCDRWWSNLFGPDLPFDPDRRRIIGLDWLDRPWPDGSVVSTAQQAQALAAVLDAVGIARIDCLVGASYGAMVGLAFAAELPQRLARLVAISGADRAYPAATARRLIQRRILRLGQSAGEPLAGLALARSLALTTYRPDDLLAGRFGNDDPQAVLDALSSYFDHQGRRCQRHFDVQKYLCLSESIDRHRVDVDRIRCPVALVAVDSDTLVPEQQIAALAQRLGSQASLHRIQSPFGHDAFLKETLKVPALLEKLLLGVVQ